MVNSLCVLWLEGKEIHKNEIWNVSENGIYGNYFIVFKTSQIIIILIL